MSAFATTPTVDRIPPSAWVMAWLFLIGQVASLATRGVNPSDPVWVAVSMLLTALIIRWFADGVLRARTGRLTFVWIMLSATTVLSFVDLTIGSTGTAGADFLNFALTLAQLVALGVFCSTSYFTDRRACPNVSPTALAPLLLIAVATGLLGGLTAPWDVPGQDGGTSTHLRVGL